MIPLGSQVEDTVTGFKGTVTSEHIYLNGCVRYGVSPRVKKDGTLLESQIIDEPQLKITKRAAPKPVPAAGGPRPNPNRPIAPASSR